MRIIRYFKEHVGVVLLIAALLVVQAFCDLSLPNYTADIVNVGIQQSGVESAVPEKLSEGTFDAIAMMLPEDQEAEFKSYYQEESGVYSLNEKGRENQDAIREMVMYPLVITQFASQSDAFDLSQLTQAYGMGLIGKDQVAQGMDAAKEKLSEMGDSIVEQQAVAAVKAEYEACDVDMDSMQLRYLLIVGAKMLGVTLLGAIIAVIVSYLASRTGASIARSLRERLFKRVVSFSDAEIQRFSAASLITRGTNDIQQIQMVCILLLRMVLFAPILAIGGIIMILKTTTAMTWIIVIAVLLVFCVVGLLMAVALPKFKIMQTLIDKVNLVSREVLTGLPVIRAFNRQKFEEERFDKASLDLKRTQLFTNRTMSFMMPSMMLILNGVSALIVWVGASYIDQGVIQTGDMIAFITYSMVIIMSFLMMSMVAIFFPRAQVAAGRVDEVLSTEPSIVDPERPLDDQLGKGEGVEIAFENVGFTYSDSSQPVLSDITFTAEPGKTTAIIGSTGSGKTSILRLLTRSYDVTQGKVTIDGIDVRDLSQRALHATLGYVPQKAFLFSGTIGSNIAYSNDDMDDEKIWLAADVAQASDFIESKEEMLDSPIAQGGTDVSGGQRQRLAIARAIATDAKAFLFDDSFSALDYKTDAKLRAALSNQLGGKTVLIVAQRISTIRNADNIIVLDEGRIVGQGTHDKLMQDCPEYREIAESQLSEDELKGGDAR